jgi:hypothetical protein
MMTDNGEFSSAIEGVAVFLALHRFMRRAVLR